MIKKTKRILPLNKIDDLDDETYYFIKHLDKQVDEWQYKTKMAEETLFKVLGLINSNEDLAHFYCAKQEIRKPIEDYFKKVK